MHELSELITTFHDGELAGIQGDFKRLELQIDCMYLAEMEQAGYASFYLILTEVTRFEFRPWGGEVITDLKKIKALELEIGNAQVKDGIIQVSCNTYSHLDGISGGELYIEAQFDSLYNHERRSMSPPDLFALSTRYWDRE